MRLRRAALSLSRPSAHATLESPFYHNAPYSPRASLARSHPIVSAISENADKYALVFNWLFHAALSFAILF